MEPIRSITIQQRIKIIFFFRGPLSFGMGTMVSFEFTSFCVDVSEKRRSLRGRSHALDHVFLIIRVQPGFAVRMDFGPHLM
jgi:hypothetical protein